MPIAEQERALAAATLPTRLDAAIAGLVAAEPPIYDPAEALARDAAVARPLVVGALRVESAPEVVYALVFILERMVEAGQSLDPAEDRLAREKLAGMPESVWKELAAPFALMFPPASHWELPRDLAWYSLPAPNPPERGVLAKGTKLSVLGVGGRFARIRTDTDPVVRYVTSSDLRRVRAP